MCLFWSPWFWGPPVFPGFWPPAKPAGPANPPANDNYQFTNFTVAAGATLAVFSGTVIRCTGTCTIDGTILVSYGSVGGVECMNQGVGLARIVDPGPDPLGNVAGFGEASASGQSAFGGIGYGPIPGYAEQIINVDSTGGGGGAGNGGQGGGALTVLAETAVVNGATGSIVASGQTADGTIGCAQGGGGGGGGGIVILASKGAVTNAGAIDVSGGGGGPSSTFFAPGGGGAGGIVHLLAPTVTNTGTANVAVGAQGTGTGTLTASPRGAGGAGGSSGGYGGAGADINTSNAIAAAAGGGQPGHVFTSQLDPTALFY
jgi:hypothetical protein